MIAEDIRFLDIDAGHWTRLVDFVGRLVMGGEDAESTDGRRLMLILYRSGHVLKAIHSELGVVHDLAFDGPDRLRSVAEEYGAEAIWAVEDDAILRMLRSAESSVRHDDDIVEQALCYYHAFREVAGRGIYRYPDVITGLPEIRYPWLARAMKMIFPRNRTILFYLFDDDGIDTSLILGTNDRELALITTHDHLASAGLRIDDWRLAYRSVVMAVSERIAAVHLGIFAERRGIERLLSGEGSIRDRIGESIRAGELIIDPLPARLKAALFLEDLYRRIKGVWRAKGTPSR